VYDPKSESSEFIGADRAEAVSSACRFFGVEESELAVREFNETQVAGTGGRAVIVARLKTAPPPRPSSGRDDDRGRDRDRGGRGGRDRDRGERGGRGGRDRDRGGRGGRDRDRDRGDRDGGREASAPVASIEPSGPSVGTAVGELQGAGQFLLGVIERMELGPFEIQENDDEKVVAYQISGEAAGRLSEGEGRAPDALQLLVNQAAMRIDEDHKKVVVDVEGDQDQRDAFLARIANRAAKRAKDTGRSVALDAMNSKDRRSIHVALREEEGVATMSIGEGRYRQVVVVPEGAPEYQEATSYADQAS